MHRFSPVANSRCSQRDVLDEPQDSHPVFGRNRSYATEILLDHLADFRMFQVFLGGHGHHEPAGDIFGQARNFIWKTGNVLLADVGQQHVYQVVSRGRLVAFRRTGDAAGIKSLIEVHHFDELVFNMGSLHCAVIVRGQRRCADQHITHAHLAAAIALAMVSGETLDKGAAELILTGHKNIFPRDEHVVENHQGFMSPVLAVADIYRAALQFAGIAGLAAVNVEDALRIGRSDEGDSVIGILLGHGHGRHDQNPV